MYVELKDIDIIEVKLNDMLVYYEGKKKEKKDIGIGFVLKDKWFYI